MLAQPHWPALVEQSIVPTFAEGCASEGKHCLAGGGKPLRHISRTRRVRPPAGTSLSVTVTMPPEPEAEADAYEGDFQGMLCPYLRARAELARRAEQNCFAGG